MQIVIWFAGLRGAIAFALSQNMPGANRDLYITTTLSVVIFTTIFCGGLTEPLLTRTQMKKGDFDDDEEQHVGDDEYGLTSEEDSDEEIEKDGRLVRRDSKTFRSFWKSMDDKYLKPVFSRYAKPRLLSRPSRENRNGVSMSINE